MMMMTHIKYQDLKSHVEMISYGTRQPGHHMGLMSYFRDTFWILGHETQTSQDYESIFLCVQHSYLPIPVQLISTFHPGVHMCTLERSLTN